MINILKYLGLVLITFLLNFRCFSIDTLIFQKRTEKLNPYFYTYIDSTNNLKINDVINKKFVRSNNQTSLNFGLNKNNCWIKFSLKNLSPEVATYFLVISNPDLNYLDYYEFEGSKIKNEAHTGELRKKNSRPIPHRFFLFKIELKPNISYNYFICSNNNGDSNIVPIYFQTTESFYKEDMGYHFFYAIIYGIFIFIMIFNFYLYQIVKDKIYLYYLVYILFSTIFFLSYDGYLYYLGWQWLSNIGRILIPSIAVVYFIAIAQKFIESSNKWPGLHKILNILKLLMIVFGILPIFNFSFFISMFVFGITILFGSSFIIFTIYAFKSYNKNYMPSLYFLLAFIVMVVFTIIYPLKEVGVLPYNFFTVNSVRFGFTLESILLTIAVLERFRLEQENAKKTIEKNLSQIEVQNKELEVINTELEKLSIVASETDNSVAIYDKQGRIEWCNSGFEKFYEKRLNDLIKNKKDLIEDIVPHTEIRDFLYKCISKKEPVIFESRLVTGQDKEKWVQTTLSPYIKSGKVSKIIAVDSDISALKEYEINLRQAKEKAEESDRLKTVFLGNMSHEIRTPLNGILGFSELLRIKELTDEKKDKYIKLIMSNGDQLIRIIDDIVDISLIESNQLKIYPIDFSLSKLNAEIIEFFELYKSTIEKSHVDLVTDLKIDTERDIIRSDPFRLKQVLMNIIRNGFKFTDKGYVKLGCYPSDKAIMYFVEDSGVGVEPGKKDIVFDQFRQGDESLSRKYSGTGLGLSISKGIIRKMGGKIWIDEEYTKGFRVCFTIPLVLSDVYLVKNPSGLTTSKSMEKIRNKRILIVEDHDVSYEYLVEVLKPYHAVISRANDGKKAIDLIKQQDFDMVLMDINLPVMDGVSATLEIRKFNRVMPIIAQTAYAMESEKSNILASGCTDIISKPINSKDLLELIEQHLG